MGIKRKINSKIQSSEMKYEYLRRLTENTILDKVRNGTTKETLKQKNVGLPIEMPQLRLFRHICKMKEIDQDKKFGKQKWQATHGQ